LLKRKNVKYEIIEDGSNPARSLAWAIKIYMA
jgi:hypothetical protein